MEVKAQSQFIEQDALSFDDVLLQPGYSDIHPQNCDLSSKLGNFLLKTPVLSAAMDTVTEAKMAIALALEGGIGVIHRNLSIEEQVAEIRRVKRFQHAVISDPETVSENDTVAELRQKRLQTGVTGFPVVNSQGILVGICTGRDIRYVQDDSSKVKDVMSRNVHTLNKGASEKDSIAFFRNFKVEKCPLVDKEGRLCGLMTSKDLYYSRRHPNASRDEQGALSVAAAVGVGARELERAQALVDSRVDALCVDSSHGFSKAVIEMVAELRKNFPEMSIMAGNVGAEEGAVALAKAGANIVKVGIGPGSICTTRIVTGVGVPQFSATWKVARRMRKDFPQVGVIADGGMRYSGDVIKALAAGAHAVMLGSFFAGTEESPGETILYQGRSYKSYRGMGSLGAMKKGRGGRYHQEGITEEKKLVPEGVEARVPYRGMLKEVLYQLVGGVQAGMGLVGAKDLGELFEKSRFVRISQGALRESHVHDVTITAEAPNYTGGRS